MKIKNIVYRMNYLESEFEKIRDLIEREGYLSDFAKKELIKARSEKDVSLVDLDEFEEKYDYMEFQLKTMEVEKEYEKNPRSFVKKTEEDFLEELKEW